MEPPPLPWGEQNGQMCQMCQNGQQSWLEKRVEKCGCHPSGLGEVSPPRHHSGRSAGKCIQDGSAGKHGPGVLDSAAPGTTCPAAAAPSARRAGCQLLWNHWLPSHARRAAWHSLARGCPTCERSSGSRAPRPRTADSRLWDRRETQNGWARNSSREHLLRENSHSIWEQRGWMSVCVHVQACVLVCAGLCACAGPCACAGLHACAGLCACAGLWVSTHVLPNPKNASCFLQPPHRPCL